MDKEIENKLREYFSTDVSVLNEREEKKAKDVVMKVKGKLSEMGFKETRNPLDRIMGYQMKKGNGKDTKVGVKVFHIYGLEFAVPTCRVREVYFVGLKINNKGVKKKIGFLPNSVQVLDYIKNNVSL